MPHADDEYEDTLFDPTTVETDLTFYERPAVVEPGGIARAEPDAAIVSSVDNRCAVIRIGGVDYPWYSGPNCKVCNSNDREFIENMIFAGRTYAAIVRQLPEWSDITTGNIGDHIRRDHMPLNVTVRAALVKERAEELRLSIEDTQHSVIDYVLFCRAVVADAFASMAAGVHATLQEGLAAARVLAFVNEMVGQSFDREVMVQVFVQYMRAAQKVMEPDQLEQFAVLLSADPDLAALQERFRRDNTVDVLDAASTPV